jgi:hypothetical protein
MAFVQHLSNCVILPLEEWDQKTPCSCGAWEKRKAEALGRGHYLIENNPHMEELLWLPLGSFPGEKKDV